MKTYIKYIIMGISTFILGCILIIFLDLLLRNDAATGPINCNIFNIGVYSIVFSILFLAAVLVVCTTVIIKILEKNIE